MQPAGVLLIPTALSHAACHPSVDGDQGVKSLAHSVLTRWIWKKRGGIGRNRLGKMGLRGQDLPRVLAGSQFTCDRREASSS